MKKLIIILLVSIAFFLTLNVSQFWPNLQVLKNRYISDIVPLVLVSVAWCVHQIDMHVGSHDGNKDPS